MVVGGGEAAIHCDVQSILTRSGGPDYLLYHQRHGISQIIARLWKAPPIPFCAFRLSAVIPVDGFL